MSLTPGIPGGISVGSSGEILSTIPGRIPAGMNERIAYRIRGGL